MALNKSQLLTLFGALGFHPSRKLGQNFLLDVNLLDYIARAAAPAPGERIVEIGPGFGTLTDKLLEAGAMVTAIELDHRLCAHLRGSVASERFTLVEANACDVDYDALSAGSPFRLVSNLPYSISTPLVATMATLDNPPSGMLLLVQKETGDRFASFPTTKEYGWLSALLQCVYTIERLRNVPPEVFFPRPEIESALLRLKLKDPIPSTAERGALRRLTTLAFSSRRKKMLGNLARGYDSTRLKEVFGKLGISHDARAEELFPEQFQALSRAPCFSVTPIGYLGVVPIPVCLVRYELQLGRSASCRHPQKPSATVRWSAGRTGRNNRRALRRQVPACGNP